jgi:hypothetical protein
MSCLGRPGNRHAAHDQLIHRSGNRPDARRRGRARVRRPNRRFHRHRQRHRSPRHRAGLVQRHHPATTDVLSTSSGGLWPCAIVAGRPADNADLSLIALTKGAAGDVQPREVARRLRPAGGQPGSDPVPRNCTQECLRQHNPMTETLGSAAVLTRTQSDNSGRNPRQAERQELATLYRG